MDSVRIYKESKFRETRNEKLETTFMENLLIIFIVVTAMAVVLQAGVLVALYMSVTKTSARMESLAGDVHKRAVPILDAAGLALSDSREKMQAITDNLLAASTSLRTQMERVDVTMSDIVDRTRMQVIRADEMVSRTLDRVEETTELVQHSVISPVKQLAGIVSGLSVGLDAFFRRNRRRTPGMPQVEDEEMFI